MPEKNIRRATRREPRLEKKSSKDNHSSQQKPDPKTKRKVNVILKNTIGPDSKERKVRIPENAPVSLLKEKIGQLYGLDPDDFHLSHVPGSGGQPSTLKLKQQSTPTKTASNANQRQKTGKRKGKQPVRIVIRNVEGQEKFQKTVNIPDTVSIGKIRDKIAQKLDIPPDELELNLVRETSQ